jgi:hypothetical protein
VLVLFSTMGFGTGSNWFFFPLGYCLSILFSTTTWGSDFVFHYGYPNPFYFPLWVCLGNGFIFHYPYFSAMFYTMGLPAMFYTMGVPLGRAVPLPVGVAWSGRIRRDSIGAIFKPVAERYFFLCVVTWLEI